eukprot:CAMPEP_0113948634 /NCGR_PEP_ID=MMETSP1339-20121228/71178_1 /TAXON_ID=94617 /ORGANISM="Fibrocapsa japonica" /LENGTH=90 /DNA_ID=CAMNT_0000955749 /DNA_START=84 /DNA_END=353 /DNA_ORIENTATION=- /assembly_acc=CAM_ASM_000762
MNAQGQRAVCLSGNGSSMSWLMSMRGYWFGMVGDQVAGGEMVCGKLVVVGKGSKGSRRSMAVFKRCRCLKPRGRSGKRSILLRILVYSSH